MAIRSREIVEEGTQPPLFGVAETTGEESHSRKIGLLTRILSGIPNGVLYRDIRGIEANFKAGGTRTKVYPYRTSTGEKTVEATPEDIRDVLGRRRIRAGLRQR